MILVAGGTGTLGSLVVPLLVSRGLPVRVLTRDPARAGHLAGPLVELVTGDVADRASVDRACVGAEIVVSAIQGFGGRDPRGTRAIDRDGNATLIDAAAAAGVKRFILLSIAQGAADHPIELFRMKFAAEERLRASTLSATILRPTAYMETWFEIVGRPVVEGGATRVFGRGDNPINFVSAVDVARFVELAVADPALEGVIDIPGPENLGFNAFVSTIAAAAGAPARVSHVPRAMLRLMSVAARPVRPVFAAQVAAALAMDTRDMTMDPAGRAARYPGVPFTHLDSVVRERAATVPRGAAATVS